MSFPYSSGKSRISPASMKILNQKSTSSSLDELNVWPGAGVASIDNASLQKLSSISSSSWEQESMDLVVMHELVPE